MPPQLLLSSTWTQPGYANCTCACLPTCAYRGELLPWHFTIKLLTLTHTNASRQHTWIHHMCKCALHMHASALSCSCATHTHTYSLAAPFWSMEIIYSCHDAWFPICYWDPEQLERENEGGKEEREREERQLERLPTAGNQLPVTESLFGSNVEVKVEGERRED